MSWEYIHHYLLSIHPQNPKWIDLINTIIILVSQGKDAALLFSLFDQQLCYYITYHYYESLKCLIMNVTDLPSNNELDLLASYKEDLYLNEYRPTVVISLNDLVI